MKLIVGLGNPGTAYLGSRHNIGFLAVKELARQKKAVFKKGLFSSSLTTKINLAKESVLLAMPLTFMNLSGPAVKALFRKYKLDPGAILVICDDMDLEFGRQKIRARGSSGGQRGLQSIIEAFGFEDFARLRVGIGRPRRGHDPSDYVLENFSAKEKEELPEVVGRAATAALMWAQNGITETMNIYNKKEQGS